jgi:elongation factor P--(R)-beta-lysine ligase
MNVKNTLIKRAAYINQIRSFFAARSVLEVSTPVMAKFGVTDPNITNIKCKINSYIQNHSRFLQTSPEYAMKKLLAMGVGSIYQICPAFRDDPATSLHRAEFTMLEWYRVNYDYHDLILELIELLTTVQPGLKVEKTSYRELFVKHLELDPFTASAESKQALLTKHVGAIAGVIDLDDAIMSLVLQPLLKSAPAIVVYDYPASQASLAKLAPNKITAERFELFLAGVEVANGFTELLDPIEQLVRFKNDNSKRKQLNLPEIAIDHDFIAALEQGLPPCAGIAVGIERLLISLLNCDMQDLTLV